MIDTPVVLFVFNRPTTTVRVFREIARVAPRQLLVVADGPRPGRSEDQANCAAARSVSEKIDWPCEVLRKYSETHLGCRRRLITGLDWAFGHCDEAIILEDDCLPDPSFFHFCAALLERFRNDARIGAIIGNNYHYTRSAPSPYSYAFTRFPVIWGWATWRQAWQCHDPNIVESWPEIRSGDRLADWFPEPAVCEVWKQHFDRAHAAGGSESEWIYSWFLSCWMQGKLSIFPSVNLISNIGFGPDATHTKRTTRLSNFPSRSLAFPLSHPPYILPDRKADAVIQGLFAPRRSAGWTRLIERLDAPPRNWLKKGIATGRRSGWW